MAVDLGLDLTTFVGSKPDLDPHFGFISGRRAVGEVLARMLQTRRDTLPGAPNRGTDIRSYLHEKLVPERLFVLAAQVSDEATKDERVDRAAAQISYVGEVLRIKVLCEDSRGPFTLVLVATSVTVELLRVE